MTVDADAVALAATSALEQFGSGFEDGWTRRVEGALAIVTMVPFPTLNGVIVDGVRVDVSVVEALLDEVAATGIAHCLQLRPGCDQALGELAERRGMIWEEAIPMMALDDPGELPTAEPPGLEIVELAPEQAPLHAQVAAAGFGVPEEGFRKLVTPAVVRVQGARCYLGTVEGEPVTTGFALTHNGSVGVFNISTPAAHQRRGYGAAVTARAVRDGFASGARYAWLQSSDAGYRVYERLGFTELERWACWVSRAE